MRSLLAAVFLSVFGGLALVAPGAAEAQLCGGCFVLNVTMADLLSGADSLVWGEWIGGEPPRTREVVEEGEKFEVVENPGRARFRIVRSNGPCQLAIGDEIA